MGSPDKIEVTATIIGPRTGILIPFAALPNTLNNLPDLATAFAAFAPNNFVISLLGAFNNPFY
ncbi:MAG: hypothetical protein CM15mL2_0390 [Caudoviricetes sp.]|nr:MAG: hypothetical protein CM15mL2_0390 [Caudoviricetes sp.]